MISYPIEGEAGGPRPGLLLLSDKPGNIELLRDLFGATCEVTTADEFDFARGRFDLCLIDAGWAGRFGALLARKKREQPDTYLPTLGLLTGDMPEDVVARFDETIRVPCTKSELVHRVENLLRVRRLSVANQSLLAKLRGDVVGLRRQTDEAESANQTKSAFLANMSHEIRTPLGVILGFGALLKDPSLGPSERDGYVDAILRNGRALTTLIDDILDLAKVEAGKLRIEELEFALPELLDECVEMFRDKARQNNLGLELVVPPGTPGRVRTDPARLRQILINLIGNAIKFTATGGIRVSLSVSHGDGDRLHCEVAVADTGIGLSPAERRRLFQPFVQADDTTARKYGGTGLGLTLSKRLARALDGDIVLADEPAGEGCTFKLTFRARGAEVAAGPAARSAVPAPAARLDGLSILIVDDSPDNLFLGEHLLKGLGARATAAASGEEALAACASGAFDCVLLDIQMPGMDGFQTIAKLRDGGYQKPVVALTAHAMLEERERTRAAGFSGHVTKPVDRKALVETVRAALKGSG